MKRIGIMTFYGAKNFGANLQAYALQTVLSQQFSVAIINYKSRSIHKAYYQKKDLKEIVKDFIKSIVFYKYISRVKKKRKLFEEFNSKYTESTRIYTSEDIFQINEEFDIVISGSDQVWNDRLLSGDWNYLLPFLDSSKKYSYAASFGGKTIKEENKEIYKKLISSYQSILLRENSGIEVLRQIGIDNHNVKVVSDPVFLMSQTEWKKRLSLSGTRTNDYILILIIAKETYSIEYASELSKEMNCHVKFININDSRNGLVSDFDNIIEVGPIEFLNLIINAKCVVTTSFHALAFSLIFNTPFFFELNHSPVNNNDRIEQLSTMFGLQQYEITSPNATGIGEYDWERINLILDKYRNESLKILFDSLPN